MAASWKARLVERHERRWSDTLVWAGYAAAFFSIQGVMLALLLWGQIWLCVPLILALGYLNHCHLIAFHETSHHNLCPNRWVNDAIGYFIGALGLMSLSLYRAVHYLHHNYLGTERDEELWPFVDPAKPRWFRRLAAFLELTAGMIYTPLLFVRCFVHRGSPITDPSVRRRVWIELGAIVVLWTTILAVTFWFNLWLFLLMLHVLPAFIAGNLQSTRKFVEHLGVTGPPPLGTTRSIVPVGLLDRLIVLSMFQEPYHGIHHQYAKLPQMILPEFADLLTPTQAGEIAPFYSFRPAFWEMVKSLPDPRTGPQWLTPNPAGPEEAKFTETSHARPPVAPQRQHVRA